MRLCSAWSCEEEVHGGGTPVRPQRGQWVAAEAAAIASVMSRTWNAIASTQARAIWARPAPRVRPVTMPRAAGSHCGLPEPGQRGDERDATAVGDRRGQRADLRRRGDDAEPVAQPLDGRARDEGRALERVGDALSPAGACAPRSQAQLTVRPSGAGGRSGPALASTKLPVP